MMFAFRPLRARIVVISSPLRGGGQVGGGLTTLVEGVNVEKLLRAV